MLFSEAVPGGHVFVATDSSLVVADAQKYFAETPKMASHALHIQPDVLRSKTTNSVFKLYRDNHDATNRQVLTDIGALSRCTFMVHVLSAVSEAAVFHNPSLHARSVNLEDTENKFLKHQPRQTFAAILEAYKKGKATDAIS